MENESEKPMPANVKKPNHIDKRYYKVVEGKKVFNQKRWASDNMFYKKWLDWKNNSEL